VHDAVRDPAPSPLESVYTSGAYRDLHPNWHAEESAWKAAQVLRMLERHELDPRSFVEVGCGVGEILSSLQRRLGDDRRFHGYDISPQAIEQARNGENPRLLFSTGDVRDVADAAAECVLVMDVLEHVEDRFGFLRDVRRKGEYKIFHVSLIISVQNVLRENGLLKMRDAYGMTNFYSKQLLLQNLRDAGHEIVDWFYTSGSTDLPSMELARNLIRYPRKLLFAVNEDLAARLLGGYRLLVLTR
jgi:SAM-dependent methyltransferase